MRQQWQQQRASHWHELSHCFELLLGDEQNPPFFPQAGNKNGVEASWVHWMPNTNQRAINARQDWRGSGGIDLSCISTPVSCWSFHLRHDNVIATLSARLQRLATSTCHSWQSSIKRLLPRSGSSLKTVLSHSLKFCIPFITATPPPIPFLSKWENKPTSHSPIYCSIHPKPMANS